jgi:hypothetical protein
MTPEQHDEPLSVLGWHPLSDLRVGQRPRQLGQERIGYHELERGLGWLKLMHYPRSRNG